MFPYQVFDIGRGQHSPITGLEFHLVPHTRGKYIILATTQTRMYQFQGNVSGGPEQRPLLLEVFSRYLNVPEKFIELPGIQGTYSTRYDSLFINHLIAWCYAKFELSKLIVCCSLHLAADV